MQKPIDATGLLSSAAMVAKKADSYSPETYVIDLAELRLIIFEMQEDAALSEIQKSDYGSCDSSNDEPGHDPESHHFFRSWLSPVHLVTKSLGGILARGLGSVRAGFRHECARWYS